MYINSIIKQILSDMRRYKSRSVLAIFGITWGTVSVVLLLALGQGFYHASKASMQGFTEGALLVYPGSTELSYRGLPIGRALRIRPEEVMVLPRAIPRARAVSPVIINTSPLYYHQQQVVKAVIYGVNTGYEKLINLSRIRVGRFINELDVQRARAVAVIGASIKTKLFLYESAVGKTIFLHGIPFTIVGLLPDNTSQGLSIGINTGNKVMIPYTTALNVFGDKSVDYFVVMAQNFNQTPALQQDLLHYLAYQYRFDSHDKTVVQFFDFTQAVQFFDWFFRAIELFLGLCGSMTLGVGGVGLANTMYLIIVQRTAEIGLRKALGARDWQIMLQFIVESAVLMGIGALIGFFLAIFSVVILQYISLPQWLGKPELSPLVIISTLFILMIIGMVASYFPARHASKMTPIRALAFDI